jgi:cytochrome c peroxidase
MLVLAVFCPMAHGAALEFNITPKFSGEPLQADLFRYETSAREKFSVTRVSFLLSGIALQRADGSWLELTNEIAWFDLERERLSHHVASVPAGEYRSVRFTVGLDEKLNHANPAQFAADHPLNPNLNNLHWSWQGGYIFMALEGRWQERRPPARLDGDVLEHAVPEAGAPSGWSFHLARDTNAVCITLAAQLHLTNDTQLELDFDLATLLNAPRPLSFVRDGSSTHSRDGDPIAAALVVNLPGAFQVQRITAGRASVLASRGEPAADGLRGRSPQQPLYLPEKFTPYRFQMSAMFPVPDLPKDNPLIAERVALGEKLFHEPALSKDNTISCASCHDVKHAFAEPRRYSIGVGDRVGTRNAMPLFNLAWKSSFFWDGRAPSLRVQALLPIQDHAEMDESLTNVVAKLRSSRGQEAQTTYEKSPSLLTSAPTNETDYPALFNAAYGSPEITPEKIGLALENYLLTLTSFDSKFDRAQRGEAALSTEEQRGLELFMTEYDPRREQFGADCFHCHGGPLFQSQTFANNGSDGALEDIGREKVTGKAADRGKFAVPSLRNIVLTAPYMHDGRFRSLEDVVEHYSTGIPRVATLDPNLAKHPDGGVPLNAADKRALVAFLKTLTDPQFTDLSRIPAVGQK